MTNPNTLRALLLVLVAAIAMEGATAHRGGRHHGWSMSCANNSCSPRRRHRGYHYSRRSRDAFDLVSDIFSIPFYSTANSLFRQQALQRSSEGPRYAVSETEEGRLEFIMEVPGVAAEDLTVEVEDGAILRIRGSRAIRGQSGSQDIQNYEFDHAFQLDQDVDLENISVTLDAGILTVTAPKRQPVKRRLPISVNSGKTVLSSVRNQLASSVEAKAAESTVAVEKESDGQGQDGAEHQDSLEISEEEEAWQ